MPVAWTWDATISRLTAVATGLAPATEYEMRTETKINGGGSYATNGITDGSGDLTLEFTDLVPLGPGNMFSAFVYDKATAVPVAIMVFTAEVSSSGDGLTASFTHDGANGYTVQIQTQNGRTYILYADDHGVTGGGGFMTWVGDGTLETQTLDLSATPIPGGSIVRVFVGDYDNRQLGNGGPPLACGMQVQGTAGAATSPNPGGGSYDPLFIGTAEPIEGTWVFAYNGTSTLTAVGTGLQPGRTYGLLLDACSDNFVEWGTADGSGNLTLVQTGIIDPATCYGGGPGMQALIEGGVAYNSDGAGNPFDGLGKYTKIIEYGTPSAGIDGVGTWTFDGVEFGSVAFQTAIGVEYDVSSYGVASIIDTDGPITGDGTVMTIHWRITNPTLFDVNDGLFSQTALELYNNTVYEDIGAYVFTYGDAFPTPPQPAVLVTSPPWRFVVTGLAGATVTLLDKLATNRRVVFTLNAPALAEGDLPSDNPEINILRADGDPFVSYNNRLVYGFRRETGQPPWVCRFGGILAMLEDEAGSDQPTTHYTAYDPWSWLNSVPLVTDVGDLLPQEGLAYEGIAGNVIALDLLTNGLAAMVASNPSQPLFIDQVSGHFDTTDPLDITFQQGMSVGEAWTELADTGSMDIVLDPVYDPVGRPGIVSVLSIYSEAGIDRDSAIFAWDLPSRSLVGISRLLDGTQMGNVVQLYNSAIPATQASDAASIAKYGEYWFQRAMPGQTNLAAVALLATAQMVLRRKGKRTITINPAPERSPEPLSDYRLGDRIPVYAGRAVAGGGISFRQRLDAGTVSAGRWTNPQRVYQIPIDISDDDVETVTELLLTDPNQ